MNLEEYFHSIQQEKPMIKKDTTVSVSINQDNSDLDNFPDTYQAQTMSYSGPTWIEMLEDFIKLLELHYGYPIREHVYYAVKCPLFDHNYSPAPGREMHQDKFMELLKDHPELNNGGEHTPINTDWE